MNSKYSILVYKKHIFVNMDEQTKLLLESGYSLPLMEAFYSIQGEGFYSGSSAYFLRIGGCDVGCHWCDVKESWDANLHPPTPIDDIIGEINKERVRTVVITGGEPLMWNLEPLTKKLRNNGYNIHLETSGAYTLSGVYDWICLSPKKQQKPLLSIKKHVNELKVIIHNKNDLAFAKQQQLDLPDDCQLYLQPEWNKKEEVTPMIIDFVQDHKDWKISLQSHKYMNIP